MSSKRIAVYPGSFDPFTSGHLDIACRAAQIFDEVIVAVGANPSKQSFFPLEQRESLIRESVLGLPRLSVNRFSGLVVDFAQQVRACAIIRGMRAGHDFDAEFQFFHANDQLDGSIEAVYLFARPRDIYLSSSVVREAASLGKRIIRGSVPPPVEVALKERFHMM